MRGYIQNMRGEWILPIVEKNMAQKTWTRSEIENLVSTNDLAVERAMVALLSRQTEDEKVQGTVNHNNHKGFAASNSRKGTYFAKWVQSGRHLTGAHLEKARKIALFHAGQLTDIANGRR